MISNEIQKVLCIKLWFQFTFSWINVGLASFNWALCCFLCVIYSACYRIYIGDIKIKISRCHNIKNKIDFTKNSTHLWLNLNKTCQRQKRNTQCSMPIVEYSVQYLTLFSKNKINKHSYNIITTQEQQKPKQK